MNNSDLILELLDDVFPATYCDECIANELEIQPRQQVNQIAHKLELDGRTERQRGVCSNCKKIKTTNAIIKPGAKHPGHAPKEVKESAAADGVPAQPLDIEQARAEVVRLCHLVWRENTRTAPPHSISQVINSLKGDALLPPHQANMMLTLCSMRNGCIYENLKMGRRENEIAVNALSIIEEWWGKRR